MEEQKNNPGFDLLVEMEGRARANALDSSRGDLSSRVPVLAFTVCGKKMLVPLESVKEVITIPEVATNIPRVKSWVKGIANVRGTLLSLVDLQHFLCGTPQAVTSKTRVMVVDHDEFHAGFVVTEVHGLRHVDPSDVITTESKEGASDISSFISHYVELENERWLIFDMDKLIEDDDFRRAA